MSILGDSSYTQEIITGVLHPFTLQMEAENFGREKRKSHSKKGRSGRMQWVP